MQFLQDRIEFPARRTALLGVLIASLAGCAAQRNDGSTASIETDDRVADLSDERGACIGASQFETCAFAIAVFGPESAPTLIVSRKLASTQRNGQPVWEELHRLSPPALPQGGSLEFGSCRLRQTADDSIVALLPHYDEHSPEHIAAAGWAYRVDLPSGRFAELDASIVDCVNTAHGAD